MKHYKRNSINRNSINRNSINRKRRGKIYRKIKKNLREKKYRKNINRKKINFFSIIKKLLVLSSFVFITNIITAILYKDYIYSFIFIGLTLTSILYHSNRNIYTNILDKIAILSVVSYGTYNFYNKYNSDNSIYLSIVVVLFLIICFFYFYGYLTKQYCFNNDLYIANRFHCLLHLISSIGHHIIIIV